MFHEWGPLYLSVSEHSVKLYFKVSLLVQLYMHKYWAITIWLGLGLGFGLELLACIYA